METRTTGMFKSLANILARDRNFFAKKHILLTLIYKTIMMRNIKLFCVVILFIIIGCEKKNDCEDIACFTEPRYFTFELVDKTTNENIFTNETYSRNQIEIVNLLNDERIDYSFIDRDNLNYISIYSIGWKSEIVNCSISLDNKKVFGLYVDAERVFEDCCSFTRYNEILIEDCEFELDSSEFVYKIIIE